MWEPCALHQAIGGECLCELLRGDLAGGCSKSAILVDFY